jgi:signal transduction histidine kinase
MESGKHLLQLVNEILDWAKIDSGRLELQRAPVEMRSLLDSCRMSIEPIAAKKRVSVTFNAEEEGGASLPKVIGDSVKIRQMVDNLLSNAVKFTGENGHVNLSARVRRQANGPASLANNGLFVEVAVSDDGIGIEPANRERIFEAFAQVEPSHSPTQGTGLGLTIARRLVELHGGTITVESEPGRGSCFRVCIPVAHSPVYEGASPPPKDEARRAGD